MATLSFTLELELPKVAYPRKVLFPEGAHSILLLQTSKGLLWTLVEDAQLPYINEKQLGKGLPRGVHLLSAHVYAPAYFGITPSTCFAYLSLQLRLSALYSSDRLYKELSKVAVLQCKMDLLRAEIATTIETTLARAL